MNIISSIVTFFTESSEDPSKTSATLTGLLISLSSWLQNVAGPHIPFIANFYSSPLGQQASQLCYGLGFVIGGAWFLFGLFRKFTNTVEGKVIQKPLYPLNTPPQMEGPVTPNVTV
jgi:hypothetical protein